MHMHAHVPKIILCLCFGLTYKGWGEGGTMIVLCDLLLFWLLGGPTTEPPNKLHTQAYF